MPKQTKIKMPKQQLKKNKKNVPKPKRNIKQPRTNNTSVTSNPYFNARLCWTFVLDSDGSETSFGLRISDVFLYLREQFEIDQTMKLFFKLKSGKFMDYGYRIHTCKMHNLPTLKDGTLGQSAVKEFFPRSFSSPNGFSLKWNKSTKMHTFEEPGNGIPDDYLCIIRVGKPISDTVKSKLAYMVLNIGWRTINEDPIRESPLGVTDLVELHSTKSTLKIPKILRHAKPTYKKPVTILLSHDVQECAALDNHNALSHEGAEAPMVDTRPEPVSTSLLCNQENLSIKSLIEGVDSLVLTNESSVGSIPCSL